VKQLSPITIITTALSSLGSNKVRSGLTLLGIVIGVAAVISTMSIGKGAQQSVSEGIQSLGTNLLFVRPGASSQGGIFSGLGSASTLTLSDATAIMDPSRVPSVVAVAPEIGTQGQVVAGGNNLVTPIIGVTPEYSQVRNFPVRLGGFISPGHVQSRATVSVLGSRVAEALFGFRDPVGQAIRINGRNFTVIGVLKSKGGGAFGIEDDLVLVPITTAYYRLSSQRTVQGDVSVRAINVQVFDKESMEQATQEIATTLRLKHRITGEDDFTISSQEETITALEETEGTFTMFLAAIASISLLVGGIGIMNIMMVSVTERTREIGIRKAMGAKQRDIQLQFMAEATLLSLGGGFAGVLMGWLTSTLLNGRTLGAEQTFRTEFSPDIAVLALGVSAGIGLFFGIYPAIRASRLQPIEALRHD
jgi:putative ABC transport system permease protein